MTNKTDQQPDPQTELNQLIQQASALPGVADLVELAQQHAATLRLGQRFVTRRVITFSTADSATV